MNSNSISLYDILFESLPKGFSVYQLENELQKNLESGVNYAKKFFRESKTFTKGTSRAVFILDSKKVLKIAKNEAGLAQNKEEVKISKKFPLVVAKIFKTGTNNMYLVSELVRELTDYKELTNYFGFDIFGDLYNMIEDFISQKDKQISYARISKNKLAMQLLDMLRSGTDSGDVLRVDHWGKTTDGRYVLLDYGANKDIIKKYYQNNNMGSVSNGSYELF